MLIEETKFGCLRATENKGWEGCLAVAGTAHHDWEKAPTRDFSFVREAEEWSICPAFQLFGGMFAGLISVLTLGVDGNQLTLDAWWLLTINSWGWAWGSEKQHVSLIVKLNTQTQKR